MKLFSVILVEIIIEERPKRFMKFFTTKKRRGKDFYKIFDSNLIGVSHFKVYDAIITMTVFPYTGVIAKIAGDSDSEVNLLRTFCMKNHQPLTNNYATLLLDSDKCFSVEDSTDQLIIQWLSTSTATTQTSSTAIKCPL